MHVCGACSLPMSTVLHTLATEGSKHQLGILEMSFKENAKNMKKIYGLKHDYNGFLNITLFYKKIIALSFTFLKCANITAYTQTEDNSYGLYNRELKFPSS